MLNQRNGKELAYEWGKYRKKQMASQEYIGQKAVLFEMYF
jgi:hypothetical protein